MAHLEARYNSDPSRNWCRPLPDKQITIGKLTKNADWVVDWDPKVSGNSGYHVLVEWRDDKLFVKRRLLPEPTRNPVFYGGQPIDTFELPINGHFVIGDTRFTVLDDSQTPQRVERTEVDFPRDKVQRLTYGDPNLQLNALAELPGMIRQLPNDDILAEMVINSLLRGVSQAEGAAVVMLGPESTESEPKVIVRYSTRRGANPERLLYPSRKLAYKAISSRMSVLHIFQQMSNDEKPSFTAMPENEWAICTPLLDGASVGWGLYLAGRLPHEVKSKDSVERSPELTHDVKFCELVADLFSSIREMRALQAHAAQLERFFPRNVLRELLGKGLKDGMLDAKPCTVTVLFCDLRGSCRIAEKGQDDLVALWDTVSEALGIMTSAIMENNGVVGDFQGDAAMGFWGWPTSSEDQIEQAARAAQIIRRKFAQYAERPAHRLRGFACGVGLAHGTAIAGRIGTIDQFKIGVFGPVVNLAARLESLTKKFGVPILVDEAIAGYLGDTRPEFPCRTLARVVPHNMTAPVMVSELLLPAGEPGGMKEVHRLDFKAAQNEFQQGRWDAARRKLVFADGPTKILKAFMSRHGDRPPQGWDGVVTLEGI
ncbi:MAG TPA: adenylate/guanylate cyclase domain-containing protein [Gemmataceae bacterium]|nr:adenylate/guanylate cyclase domain-containing protein [Gemmataceae bacterium]